MKRLPGKQCRFLVTLAVAAVVGPTALGAAGCTSSAPHRPTGGPSGPSPTAPASTPARLLAHPTGLDAFGSCTEALAGLRRATTASVTAYGLPGSTPQYEHAMNTQAGPGVAAPAAAAGQAASASGTSGSGSSGSATPAYSATNVAEAGVDEPDLIKTDGQRIVTVGGNVLTVVDAATRQVTGTLQLPGAFPYRSGANTFEPAFPSYGSVNLLLSGDHALVLEGGAASAGPVPTGGARYVGPTSATRLLLIDLSGAGAPRVISTYSITGQYVDARMVGSVVRVVTRTAPHFILPVQSGASGSQAEMLKANRAVVARADLSAWLPSYTTTGAVTTGTVSASGTVPCTSVSHPAAYSGTDLLTVGTFDLSGSLLGTGEPVSIEADGDTVYGTASSLYIASGNQWDYPGYASYGGASGGASLPVGVRQQTQIYRFALDGSGAPRFAASGVVPGYLVDQYALSEWNGYLRVATTTGLSWALADGPSPAGVNAPPSSSAVYELTLAGASLSIVGKVTGLGSGERIYSVRFVGPVGYVVTFRQTDPLYTVDLGDPRQPRVVGSLSLTGYSAYLHPVSSTELIGIGQSADSMGHVGGLQVSLFSVANLAAPAKLATYALAQSNSAAEFDPHAFLYWPANGIVVVPLSATSGSGDLVLQLSGDSLVQLGVLTQPTSTQGAPVERSLVIGSTLWTMSEAGLMATDLSNLHQLRQEAWLTFS